MHRDGTSNRDIARAIDINRNSVSSHLAGDIVYPAEVYRKIGKTAKLVTHRWLTLREAAPWIPGHPSPAKMRVCVTGRSWQGLQRKIKLRSTIKSNRRLTSLEWVRQFVNALYPPGCWITEETLRRLAPEVAKDISLVRIGWIKGQPPIPFGDQFLAVRLCVATRHAEAMQKTIQVPAILIHRATTIEHHIGSAVF